MASTLPPGIDQATFDAAIAEFTTALGADAVSTDPTELGEFRDPYLYRDDHRRDYAAVVAPTSTEQVQQVVHIANTYRLPLWTIGQGRNNTYGGPSPCVRGSVLVNLRNMNRVLEVNNDLAYVVVEPGVRWFDIAEALLEAGNRLWSSIPDLGWGSVIGNALDNGVGYSPLSDHANNLIGMEVVLADGSVIQTGYGAQPGNVAAYTYNHSVGPSLDGLFRQSNLGIVTKAGYLVNPVPEAYAPCRLVLRGLDTLGKVVDAMRDLMIDGTITTYGTFMHSMELIDGKPTPVRDSEGWLGRFALYGTRAMVDASLEAIRARLAQVGDVELLVNIYAGDDLNVADDHDERVQRGIPDMDLLDVNVVPFGENYAHLDFSPVVPQTAEAVVKAQNLANEHYRAEGIQTFGGLILRGRSALSISVAVFDVSDEQMTAQAYRSYEALVAKFAERGMLPYRTNPGSMDAVASYLTFGDSSVPRLLRTLKKAIDPNGIIQPGKYGVWPDPAPQAD